MRRLSTHNMTVSECVKSTKPYFTLAAWKHNHPNIHSKAKREGWLDTCIDAIQTPECWDKVTCIEDAKQFKTIYAWRHGNPDAFSHAQVQEWFEECTFHFADQSMVERTWYKMRCLRSARRFESLKDWRLSEHSAYYAAMQYDWIEDCSKHFTPHEGKQLYWTLERCIEDAKKYSVLKDWRKNGRGAYQSACRHKWIEQCTAHMQRGGTLQSDGFEPKWTLEICLASAKQHTSQKIWLESDFESYKAALQYGWFKKCTEHMTTLIPKRSYKSYSKQECIASAENYETRLDWRIGDPSARNAAIKFGWYELCCEHMIPGFDRLKVKLTFDECKESAEQYNTRDEWKKGDPVYYRQAQIKGWMDECCSHMKRKPIKRTYTLEVCKASAANFSSRTKWAKGDNLVYQAASREGWMDECCSHMKPLRTMKPRARKWTEEKCMESAAKYQTRSEWLDAEYIAYKAAKRYGYFDKCVAHMSRKLKWTLETCVKLASNCESIRQFREKHAAAYSAASNYRWLEECRAAVGLNLQA